MKYMYTESAFVRRILAMFPSPPEKRTLTAFLSNPKITWNEMHQLNQLLKQTDKEPLAFFERIDTPKFLLHHLTKPAELALFCRGRINARQGIGLTRTIYWYLRENEERLRSPKLLGALSNFWKYCYGTGDVEAFNKQVIEAFLNTSSPIDFIEELDEKVLKHADGFEGKERSKVVLTAIEILADPNSKVPTRHVAIRTMGSAMELEWFPQKISSKMFGQSLTILTLIMESLKKASGDKAELRIELTHQLDQLFEEKSE